MLSQLTGCIVVNDLETLNRAVNGEQRGLILFTENGRDFIRIWPRAEMGVDGRLLAWFRDVLVVFQSVMAQQNRQTANVV